MQVIKLICKQVLVNYRKPTSFKIKESYPLPPYSTVIGMVHKACNFTEYHPMKVSIQGERSGQVSDLYTKYMFSVNKKYESDRHSMYVEDENHMKYGIIRGLGHTELLTEMNLVIHIAPENEDELMAIYEGLKNPYMYLSLGRHEDLLDIEKISIQNCCEVEEASTKYDMYVPEELVKGYKGTIYPLTKTFYIDEKTKMRRFDKPILSRLVSRNTVLEEQLVDEEKDVVVLV